MWKKWHGDAGVDVILDVVGASYFQQNLDSLNFDGRLFIIGFLGGTVTQVDLRSLLARRLTVQGVIIHYYSAFITLLVFNIQMNIKMVFDLFFCTASGLRYRSLENKAAIVREVEKNVWPAIEAGKVKPVVYKYMPLGEAAEAHRIMESNQHTGKILLLT